MVGLCSSIGLFPWHVSTSDQGAFQVTAIIFLFKHINRQHLQDKYTSILGLRVVYTRVAFSRNLCYPVWVNPSGNAASSRVMGAWAA